MTRFKFNLALCLTALAMGISTTAVRAELEPAAPEIGAASPASKAALDLAAAHRMAQLGRDLKAPEALLAAARVIGKTNVLKVELKEGTSPEVTPYDSLKEATTLIEEAIKLSGGDESVKKLATAVQDDIKEGKRGASRGPRVINGTVGRGDRRDTFSIQFRGGEQAVIIVNNRSNRGDIDLAVQDDNGRIVGRDRRRDDDANVSFFVRRTQTYQVIVRAFAGGNGRPLQYTLTTN